LVAEGRLQSEGDTPRRENVQFPFGEYTSEGEFAAGVECQRRPTKDVENDEVEEMEMGNKRDKEAKIDGGEKRWRRRRARPSTLQY